MQTSDDDKRRPPRNRQRALGNPAKRRNRPCRAGRGVGGSAVPAVYNRAKNSRREIVARGCRAEIAESELADCRRIRISQPRNPAARIRRTDGITARKVQDRRRADGGRQHKCRQPHNRRTSDRRRRGRDDFRHGSARIFGLWNAVRRFRSPDMFYASPFASDAAKSNHRLLREIMPTQGFLPLT